MAEYINRDEILKNLEKYREHTILAFDGDRPQIEIRDILGVIYRQKAEIERLEKMLASAHRTIDDYRRRVIRTQKLETDAIEVIRKEMKGEKQCITKW